MNEAPQKALPCAHAWVGLGANLGDAQKTLNDALVVLHAHTQIQVQRISSFYRSAPVDAAGPDFINAVACCTTTLSPLDMLHALQAIELQFGRERPYYHAPRTLDLDLLLYDSMTLSTPELTLPHSAMHGRAFVLKPLCELAPDLLVPGRGRVKDLLAQVSAQPVERI